MNRIYLPLLLIITMLSLSACGGNSTQVLDYTPIDNSPKLNMKASIYTALLPSGNILTLTTDQSGTSVRGAYTIKSPTGTIISSGRVENLVTNISLIGFTNSPCPTEAISITPDNRTINATLDSVTAQITGSSCSETLPTTRLLEKTNPLPASALMSSRADISSNQILEVSVKSGDNVNFVGHVTLTNTLLSISATGTIVGTVTTTSSAPASGGIVTRIDDPSAYGFAFTSTTNFSGHFFDSSDSIQLVTGNIRTSPATLPRQYFINEIAVQATNNSVTSPLGPAAAASISNYTIQ